MAITWNATEFYSNTNRINAAIVTRCITVMKKSAMVHADRDFPSGFDPGRVVRKINGVSGGNNWMKLRIGRESTLTNNNEIVIMYHLLKHRIRDGAAAGDPNYGFWSISVGIHPRLLTEPTGTANPNGTGGSTHPYKALALSLIRQIHTDLGTFTPSGQVAVIYDDIDPDEPDPAGAQGANEGKRRSTKMGELGWFCQKHTGVSTYFTIDAPVRESHPLDDDGSPIEGYGRTLSEDIVVTKLHRV